MKKNISLFIAIALPIVFILALMLMVWIPSFGVKPQYSFIYTSSNPMMWSRPTPDGRYINFRYIVGGDSRITLDPSESSTGLDSAAVASMVPNIFFYDIKTDKARSITLAEAETYLLDSSLVSPDGYSVISRYPDSGLFPLFMGGGGRLTYYIKNDKGSKQLKSISAMSMYDFQFIGWVK